MKNQVLPPFSALMGWPGPTLGCNRNSGKYNIIKTLATGKGREKPDHHMASHGETPKGTVILSGGQRVKTLTGHKRCGRTQRKKYLYVPDGKQNICKVLEGSH